MSDTSVYRYTHGGGRATRLLSWQPEDLQGYQHNSQQNSRHGGSWMPVNDQDYGKTLSTYVPSVSLIPRSAIRNWIFGTGPIFSQSLFQISTQRRRVASRTGLWFLNDKAFCKWIKEPSSFLWLHGKSLYNVSGPRTLDFANQSSSWLW